MSTIEENNSFRCKLHRRSFKEKPKTKRKEIEKLYYTQTNNTLRFDEFLVSAICFGRYVRFPFCLLDVEIMNRMNLLCCIHRKIKETIKPKKKINN